MARDKYIRPAIAVEIGDGRAEGPVLRAAEARGGSLVGERGGDRDRGRGGVWRRLRRGADTRNGRPGRDGGRTPGRERDGPRGATRLFEERVRALPTDQGDRRPRRVGRNADDLVAGL